MSNSKRYSEGNKGSDLSYRGKVLKGLQGVFDNTDQLEGISQGILNVLVNLLAQNQLDFEIKSVKDANGDVFQLRGTLDEDTGVFTWDYIDAEGNAYSALNLPGGPQGSVEFLNPDGLLTAIEALLTTIDADTSNLDVPLSTIAKETTLELIRLLLVSLDGKDFATENTLNLLAAIRFALGSDGSPHGTGPDGLRAFGSDGAIDRQLRTNTNGELQIGVVSSVLPTGAATELTLATQAADIATIEANIALLNSKFNTLGRKAEAVSTSVAVDAEAYAALLAIQTAVQNIDSDLGTGGLALETTQEASRLILVAIDNILAQIYTNLQLNTIETINIKNNTDAMVVDLAAIEVLITSGNALLTTIDSSLNALKVAVGTDSVAHGAAQKGIRALGTDGTNDQQISTDTDGKVNVLVQNPSPIPVSGTVTVNQPVSVDDNGGSLTVDATDLDIRDLAFATDKVDATGSTVALDTPTLLALESVTVQNAGLANAVNIQDGGNSITIDNSNLDTALAPATRTHNTVSATGVGSVPAGSMCGSVINAGSAAGTWNGISLPAGISIPWTQIGPRDTYGAIAYDATGTTFIIEYTT